MCNSEQKIWMIDDDNIALLIGEYIISFPDIPTTFSGFNNAQKVLDFLENELIWPDVIFVDINMPLMNGWEFVDQLQKIKKNNSNTTTLCMLSSSCHPLDMQRFKQRDHVDLYLNKPLNNKGVYRVIEFGKRKKINY